MGLSPYAVKPLFWFSLLANEIAGNFISSSGCGPDWGERAREKTQLLKGPKSLFKYGAERLLCAIALMKRK